MANRSTVSNSKVGSMQRHVYFVGSNSEVAHHAAPLMKEDSFVTKIIAAEDVVSTAVQGDVAIFFSEHFDRFRQAVVELKAKRVATIYLVDGILEWRNAWENGPEEPACPFTMRPVLADKVAVIGASQARLLSSWGNGGKIEVVGIPRLDQWTEIWRSTTSPSLREGQAVMPKGQHPTGEGSASSKETAPFRVLVATAKTPGFTTQQIETTVRSLSNLKSWFDVTDEVAGRPLEVTWRLTAGLENKIEVENNLSDLSGEELQQAIANCDAFITTPSTSMLEAMLQHKPTALLNYHLCPTYVPAAWNIHSADSIETVMQQLADSCQARLHFQQAIVADALQIAEPATDRLIQLIHSMIASCQQQVNGNDPLKFEANLLPNPVFAPPLEDHISKLGHAAVFENFNEFVVDTDSAAMKAQLAHARREIEHRQRIEDGLKAELAEAHSIFEQINQHPIAGPIVRIRERFIKFMNNKKDS